MPDQPRILRILISANDPKVLLAVLGERPLDLACGGPKRGKGGTVSVEAFVPEHEVDALRRHAVRIDVLEDASATGRARQQEVGTGNRFDAADRVPRGLGRKIREGGHAVP